MSGAVIKESALRSFVRVLLEDKTLGPAMLNVNDVVDPSASVTDPSNPNFRPQSPVELKIALNVLADEVPQENIPDIYNRIKDALNSQEGIEGQSQMEKSNKKIEEAVRLAIRQMIRESVLAEAEPPRPRPKFMPPSRPLAGAPQDPGPSYRTKKDLVDYYKTKMKLKTADAEQMADDIMKKRPSPSTSEFMQTKGVTQLPAQKSPEQVGMVPSRNPGSLGYSGAGSSAEDDVAVAGKKNIMGDVELRKLAAEFGYKNPNGVAQFIDRILEKMPHRIENIDAYEIATLEAMNEYIQKLLNLKLITPEDAELMKQNPQFIGSVSLSGKEEDPKDEGSFFKTKFLAPRLKRLDAMFKKSGV